MEAQTLYRGRLIDHIQLVVRDLAASRRFYGAVFDALGMELSGEGEDYSGSTSCSSPPPTATQHRGV